MTLREAYRGPGASCCSWLCLAGHAPDSAWKTIARAQANVRWHRGRNETFAQALPWAEGRRGLLLCFQQMSILVPSSSSPE